VVTLAVEPLTSVTVRVTEPSASPPGYPRVTARPDADHPGAGPLDGEKEAEVTVKGAVPPMVPTVLVALLPERPTKVEQVISRAVQMVVQTPAIRWRTVLAGVHVPPTRTRTTLAGSHEPPALMFRAISR
jgi:hypothetical protein